MNKSRYTYTVNKDTRYTYGATCIWHGTIQETKPNALGLPGCPHCGGVLYEIPNIQIWNTSATEYEKQHPGYTEFLHWIKEQPTCFKTYHDAKQDYELKTNKTINL